MSQPVYFVDGHDVIAADLRHSAGVERWVRVPGETADRRTWYDMVFTDRPSAVAKAIQHCCDDIQKGYAASQTLQLLRRDADAPDPEAVTYGEPDDSDDDSTSDLTRPDEGEPVATFPDTEGSLFDLIHYRDVAAAAPWCPLCRMQCYVLAGRSRCCDKPVVAALSAGDIDCEFRPMPGHLEPAGAGREPAF